MPKAFLGILALIIVSGIGIFILTSCLTWLKVLFGWKHTQLRSDTLEAREAIEDLNDAVRRETKRKESNKE